MARLRPHPRNRLGSRGVATRPEHALDGGEAWSAQQSGRAIQCQLAAVGEINSDPRNRLNRQVDEPAEVDDGVTIAEMGPEQTKTLSLPPLT